MKGAKRHKNHRGQTVEETYTYRVPLPGEYYLMTDGVTVGRANNSKTLGVLDHSVRGRVRHILREVKPEPVREWKTITPVDKVELDAAKAERDAALDRVEELEDQLADYEATDSLAIEMALKIGVDLGRLAMLDQAHLDRVEAELELVRDERI